MKLGMAFLKSGARESSLERIHSSSCSVESYMLSGTELTWRQLHHRLCLDGVPCADGRLCLTSITRVCMPTTRVVWIRRISTARECHPPGREILNATGRALRAPVVSRGPVSPYREPSTRQ